MKLQTEVLSVYAYAKRSHTRVKDPKVYVTAPHLALFSAFEQTHCALVVCNAE